MASAPDPHEPDPLDPKVILVRTIAQGFCDFCLALLFLYILVAILALAADWVMS